MIGNILNDQFSYNAMLLRTDAISASDDKNINDLTNFINTQKLIFEGVKVQFPQSKIYKSYEEVKTLFKMIMTEYRKAAEIYPLDGYVTEHVNIVKEMSTTYKTLSTLESDADRRVAMELKRKEMIQLIYKALNPKVYINLWRVLIYNLGNMH